jgi:hypothetical protein
MRHVRQDRQGQRGRLRSDALYPGEPVTRTVPIEAKWVTNGWRSEALVLRGRYGAGVLATKNIVELDGDVWAVPAPMVALLLQ